MMHRCSSGSSGNMMGPCSCDLFHHHQYHHSQSSSSSSGGGGGSFSMLFSMPNHKSFDEADMYPFMSPSSSVDCTLSLGTPSTRLTSEDDERQRIRGHDQRRSSSSCMPNFCWDFLQTTRNSPYPPQTTNKSSRGGANSSTNNNSPNDPLLARRCANCDTTSTPLWRNGPRGPKSLCNACGIRFKKEERRATAANANTNGGAASGVMEQQHHHQGYHHNNSWVHQTQAQKMPCYSTSNEFRFIEDSDQNSSDTGIPFLSWRLNVADRPSLVHDFTR